MLYNKERFFKVLAGVRPALLTSQGDSRMFQALKSKTKRIASTLAAGVLLFSQFAVVPTVGATNSWPTTDPNKISICHADSAINNPYQAITVDKSAADGIAGNSGQQPDHYSHNDPVFNSNMQQGDDWGDIIPPIAGVHAGLNWSAAGQAIWNNKCETTRVEVKKVVVPSSDSGLFNLKVEGTTYAANVGNGGTTGEVYVDEDENITVSETQGTNTLLSGYNTSIVCKNENGTGDVVKSGSSTSVTIDDNYIKNGDDIVCVITNTRKTGNLKVVKDVVNDNGGTKTYADFTFKTNSGDTPRSFDATTSPDGEKVVSLPAGSSFAVSEVQANAGGYATTYSGTCSGTIVEGQTKTCTITNNDQAGQLRVVKDVTNNNGGQATASDFTLSVNGQAKTQNQYFTADQGSYTVTESGPGGYVQTGITCVDDNSHQSVGHPVNLGLGQSVTCTVYNDDDSALLTVVKKVKNDNGGTKVAPDFTMYVSGNNVSDDEFPGDENGTTVTLNPGHYAVSEDGLAGYTGTSSEDCSGTIALGEHKYCTITNDDDAPVLVLVKKVLNYNGGTASESDWLLSAVGPTSISGWGGVISGSDFSAGSYTLSESDGPSGYTPSTWTCIGGLQEGSVISLGLGETVACTIVNSDNPAKIKVTKEVVNDNGGKAGADDFTLWVGNTEVVSGVSYEFAGNETYTIGESDGPKGYEQTSLTCVDTTEETTVENPFKAELGHNYECVIVNNDKAPTLTIKKWTLPFYTHEEFNFSSEELDAEFSLGSGDSKDFQNLETGNYTVTEGATDGWFLKNIYCWGATDFSKDLETGSVTVSLGLGDEATCKFINAELGSVSGFKFEDVNRDGHFDSENEAKLSGWTITITKLCNQHDSEGELSFLSEDSTCESFEDSTVTGEDGSYSFDGLKPGQYKVCEVLQDGWVQTKPGTEDGCRTVWVWFGSDKFVKFGNFELGKIKGVKFNDVNGNGKRDQGEPTLKNWTIKLTKECNAEEDVVRLLDQVAEECVPVVESTVTDVNGAYSFTGLEAGDYTVCEVQQANWTQTFPADNNGCHKVTVVGETSGEVATADFGNKAKPQVLGESTELVKTGASTTQGLLVGLSILSVLGALHILARRKSYSN